MCIRATYYYTVNERVHILFFMHISLARSLPGYRSEDDDNNDNDDIGTLLSFSHSHNINYYKLFTPRVRTHNHIHSNTHINASISQERKTIQTNQRERKKSYK